MSDALCTACLAPRPTHAWLCATCTKRLENDLASVPALLADLEVTITRQDVLSTDAGPRNAEQPLPWKEHASEAKYVLNNVVGTWARILMEERGTATTMPAARWLFLHVRSLAMHPAADEALDEISDAVRNAYRAIDRPPAKLLIGACTATVDEQPCNTWLYARIGDTHVTCDCGARYEVTERRESMIHSAECLLVTATVALGWVKVLLDKDIPPKTFRSWADRGRIVPHAWQRDTGYPLYRFGDVRDLAVRHVARSQRVA